ncbi:M56 family metallopeptidase [uncultured Flavobacterium sp.]|uniref:M56 family metallopeptidase n=1 Tax=uncultured Flavobacterium sp. TaxID=165435 RepID=UPI0030EEBD00|tara:strand:+ start:215730 stop:217010 length:1281 start_codon:yes stop_codon:yes gene_type:complete
MNDFLIYSLQTIVLQLLFLLVFELFFKKETFFKANRFYLLGSTVLSLLIPLIKIPIEGNVQQHYFFQLKEIVLTNNDLVENQFTNISFLTSLNFIYGIGFLLFLTFFIVKLVKILKVKQQATIEVLEKAKVYRIENSNQAFSFLNYIFIGKENQNLSAIIKHEKVHQKQLHSLDLLFLEILKIVFWFNPIIYIYQKRIVEIHEFEADSNSVSENKSSYYETLICQIFEVNSISLTNNFYNQSLIKKRLVMLQKSKSKKAGMIKYLVVVPMTVVSLMLFSTTAIAQEKNSKTVKETNEIPFAVIDEIPQFEGCSTNKGKEAKECFMNAMNEHIRTNFQYPKVALDKNNEGRVVVVFIIDTNGNVSIDKVLGTENGKLLDEEAIRIIKLLPKFKPGMYKGKAVKVSYAQPIMFRIAPPPPPTIEPAKK